MLLKTIYMGQIKNLQACRGGGHNPGLLLFLQGAAGHSKCPLESPIPPCRGRRDIPLAPLNQAVGGGGAGWQVLSGTPINHCDVPPTLQSPLDPPLAPAPTIPPPPSFYSRHWHKSNRRYVPVPASQFGDTYFRVLILTFAVLSMKKPTFSPNKNSTML